MKIAIDITSVVYETGVSVYTKNLVTNLLKIDGKNEYVLFGASLRRMREIRSFFKTLQGASFKGFVLPIPPTALHYIWNILHIFPIELFTGRIDVYHSSDWVQAPSNARKITTIHDLGPILNKKETHLRVVRVHQKRLKRVKREVDEIIVPSKATKLELEKLGFERKKITVVPEALDEDVRFQSRAEVGKVKTKYGLDKYFLSVGVNKRKNTGRIVEAFKKFNKSGEHKLVIVGQNWGYEEVANDVIFTGHISKVEINSLYQGAELLLYPSLKEGFGLPILESYFFRVPVVTSNVSSMPEVAGEAAVLVDPTSISSIADGIAKALKNKDRLVEAGESQLRNYSWEKAAKDTLEVYKKTYEDRN